MVIFLKNFNRLVFDVTLMKKIFIEQIKLAILNQKSISHRKLMNISNNISSNDIRTPKEFNPKKVLVLGKFSRYEFEKHRHANLNEDEFVEYLENHGTDYKSLQHHHEIHIKNREHIVKCLEDRKIETKVVNRFSYTEELINWADLIITSGGDGTYLLAANKIYNNTKPLIGVNSDPSRSVGHLCLNKKYSNKFDKALDMILNGQFEWDYRQRIRISLESENAFDDPIELHDQQLMQYECRFLDLDNINKIKSKKSNDPKFKKRVLPHLALNEVFVGESLSSRVSYFEMSIDDKSKFKIKSSGATICTGTGSTSWFFNINKLTPQCVSNLFNIVNEKAFNGKQMLNANDQQLVQTITEQFNNSLIFSPSQLFMAYVIRDPVVFGINFTNNPRDFAKKISIKSRMTDAHLVIDGGLSYVFNDGSKASFEIFDGDALKTIKLLD